MLKILNGSSEIKSEVNDLECKLAGLSICGYPWGAHGAKLESKHLLEKKDLLDFHTKHKSLCANLRGIDDRFAGACLAVSAVVCAASYTNDSMTSVVREVGIGLGIVRGIVSLAKLKLNAIVFGVDEEIYQWDENTMNMRHKQEQDGHRLEPS